MHFMFSASTYRIEMCAPFGLLATISNMFHWNGIFEVKLLMLVERLGGYTMTTALALTTARAMK